MRKKFTTSADGVARTTVRIKVRLTREEWAEIERLAAATDATPDEWLWCQASLAIEGALADQDGDFAQRYGKGDG